MILINLSFEKLKDEVIQNEKKIILFGAGVIGRTTLIYKLEELDLLNRIYCYVDNNNMQWGNKIKVKSYEFEIRSPGLLEILKDDKYIIIITMSQYHEVIKQLDDINSLDSTTCCIAPIMLMTQYKRESQIEIIRESKQQLIPKIIHYMWFGKKVLPKTLQSCIDSWKKYCPDYQIICWNEENYDINKNLYMKQAYKNKNWGFIPDYARLDLLYNYGGIYMDTDVELIKGLDDLLYQKAFCGVEKWQIVNLGSCSGAIKGNEFIYELMKYREKVEFINKDGTLNKMASGMYEMPFLYNHGYKINGSIQQLTHINVYPYDFFNPYDYMSNELKITSNTYAIHHFNGGWVDDEMLEQRRKTYRNYKNTIERMNYKL